MLRLRSELSLGLRQCPHSRDWVGKPSMTISDPLKMPMRPARSNHIGEGILNKMGLINRQCLQVSPIPRVITEREGIRTLGWCYPPQPAYTGCCLNQQQPLRLYCSAIHLRSFDLRNSTVLSSVTAGFVNSVEHLACLKVSVRNRHEPRTVEGSP